MRDPAREAAALIERGARRYGDGDLRGAAELWREALKKAPDDVRARAYAAWAEACEGGQIDSLAMRVAARYPSDDEIAGVLASALEGGLIDVAPPATEEDPTFDLRRKPESLPPLPTVLPSLADASETEPTRERRAVDLARPDRPETPPGGEPAVAPQVERVVVEEERTDLFRIPMLKPETEDEEYRAKAPTNPNMPPIEVAELTDDDVASLAAAAGVQLPLPRQQVLEATRMALSSHSAVGARRAQSGEVMEMEAEPEGEVEVTPADEVEVLIEMESEEGEVEPATRFPDEPATEVRGEAQPVGSAAELLGKAKAAMGRGDFEAAFAAAEGAVAAVSGVDAPELIAHIDLLRGIYEQQLGDRNRQVVIAGLPSQLDPRAAFLLSRVDGMLSIDDLRDVSGMPQLETIRLLAVLVRMGALSVR